ncbi:uncharacterized protein LOC105831060 [Monomorium pharaonis]|uniref:uncharacterized protein LOC105831060 n=1 Tax=Monomorium pharaonis TaxID=307658 RepID=UPI0017470503|nr:uncharacterized protein LOC105831060 [Monomorium pharaonis]
MKNDKIIEKALINMAQLMLLEEYLPSVMEAIKHCHPTVSKSMEGCALAYDYYKCFHDYDPTIAMYA